MKKYTYNFEVKDLLTQFVAAFDDTVIKRYNKDKEAEQEIALKHAETTSMLATARAEVQEQRLRPVMAMYEQVQANKRARLQIAQEATLAARDD